tara:strand:+ start:699 stop:1256 length:558 start_codon:yes stop_codon:yes gene_type:complete
MTRSIGLTVITGPSGVGKGTLVKKLLQRHDRLWLSVSATTRLPRSGEVNGKDYFFLKEEEFKKLVNKGGFIEWAKFAGNYYGTPKEEISNQLKSGKKVVLEIELEGARQIRKTFPEGFQLFISPPDFQELEKRIRGRATDSEEAIKKRLIRASDELKAKNEFDAVVVNDDIELALLKIEKLLGLI